MMSPNLIDWKRFWCPRGGVYYLTGDGYLQNYDHSSLMKDSGVSSLDLLSDLSCLILMGEPGMGKSTELLKHLKFIQVKARNEGNEVLYFDLRDYQTDQRLFNDIFQSPTFQKWVNGDGRLFLFLDSLDEALININVLATALPNGFKQIPFERLCLRIASRTSDWPIVLEDGLKGLWGKEGVFTYELLPLRKCDIEDYVKSVNLDSNEFIKNVEGRDGQPFAIKPVTLSFLTNIFLQQGTFPKTKKSLYLEGVRLLCTELNESRIASKRAGRLTPEQKMKIAGRIAALCMFTNKVGIQKGPARGESDDGYLFAGAILGGEEHANGNDFIVDQDGIFETLGTGLFSSRGAGRLGWSHRTYAEFLAAWYVFDKGFDHSKILSLITHPGDAGQRLIPQLHETASWMAEFSDELFTDLIKRDPDVLLRSDVVSVNSDTRASLVQSLLVHYEQERLFGPNWGDIALYKKLDHPSLGQQLHVYIGDKTKNIKSRQVAIDIAEECKCLELQQDLVSIALDVEESLQIREQAVHAVMRIGDMETRKKLMPLALGDTVGDTNDELKACSLQANWPGYISTKELFSILTPPKKDNFFGQYIMFLDGVMPQNINLEDIAIALAWVSKLPEKQSTIDPFENLVDQIMLLAWKNLFVRGILRPFALAALARMRNYRGFISRRGSWVYPNDSDPRELIQEDDERRRALTLDMLSVASELSFDPNILLYGQTPLIFRKDFEWLEKIYFTVKSDFEKTAVANWMVRVCDQSNMDNLDVLYRFHETDPIFKIILGSWFDVVELGSERAIKQKEWFEADRASQDKPPKLDPPPSERIRLLLEKSEHGDISAWWRLNLDLTLEETSNYYGDEFEQDLSQLPGWKYLDDITREKLISSAKEYVVLGEPVNKQWLGKHIIFRPAMAGYRALRLLMVEDPQFIQGLDSQVWGKWASINLAYPIRSSEKVTSLDDELIKLTYLHAQEEIEKMIGILIKIENRQNGLIDSLLKRLDIIWNEEVEAVLLKHLKVRSLSSNIFLSLLEFLLKHHSFRAQNYAIGIIKKFTSSDETISREKVSSAVKLVLIHCDDPQWGVIWDLLNRDLAMAEEVIGGLAYFHSNEKIFSSLPFEQLADLYLFLMDRYPPNEDPVFDEMHEVSVREKIGNWRDSMLSFMENSGSTATCRVLRDLSARFPEHEHLKFRLINAETNMRRKTWKPLEEKDLLTFLLSKESALVESGHQLADLIIKSLQNLDELLQGETPAAIFLWNEYGNNKYRPKDENRISDYVKIHLEKELKQRAIIVNREVEIRHGDAFSSGERTDIHIDAIKKTSDGNIYDTITVVIEIKGCWHKDLKIAMKTQLRDRYLKDNGYSFGVYLIGWFVCPQWDDSDSRLKSVPKLTLREAKLMFEDQAKELSTNEYFIKSFVLNAML